MSYDLGMDILGHRGPRGPHGHHRPLRPPAFRSWGHAPLMPWYDYPEREVYVVTDDEICDYYGPNGECLVDEILGDDVLGFIDVQSRQREMNAIKQVPVSVADVLVKRGQEAIDYAIRMAKRFDPDAAMIPFAKQKTLPRESARDNVYWKLKWHADELKKYVGKPNEIYPHGNDLKKWTIEAYVEANAVDAGSAYIDAAWAQMWREIADALAKLPKDLADKVNNIMPTWVKAVIGVSAVVVAAGVGVGVYTRVKR